MAFDIVFDGGGGANGFLNSVYLNLRYAGSPGSSFTLTQDLILSFDVVGLNTAATGERGYTVSTSYGTRSRGAYDSTTRTTSFTWTLRAGTQVPSSYNASNNPDVLFSFGDGLVGGHRVTNKIVVTGIAGARLARPVPIDSSVVRDYNQNAVSPDGIY